MSTGDKQQLNSLLFGVANGNADCLDGIYEIAGGRMMAVAMSIVKNRQTAEDIVHDSFIKIVKYARRYKSDGDGYAWVMSIVRNTALDYIRKRRQHIEVSAEEIYNLSSSDYSPEKRENAIMLESALNKLAPDERKIIYLTYYLEMPLREIATELGISKSTADRKLQSAQKNLKILLNCGTNDD
jgi:RNA polymerase sigma-70 factor (ECF subfamily)